MARARAPVEVEKLEALHTYNAPPVELLAVVLPSEGGGTWLFLLAAAVLAGVRAAVRAAA